MQMCHSLGCKKVNMSMVNQLISSFPNNVNAQFYFSSREFRSIVIPAGHAHVTESQSWLKD